MVAMNDWWSYCGDLNVLLISINTVDVLVNNDGMRWQLWNRWLLHQCCFSASLWLTLRLCGWAWLNDQLVNCDCDRQCVKSHVCLKMPHLGACARHHWVLYQMSQSVYVPHWSSPILVSYEMVMLNSAWVWTVLAQKARDCFGCVMYQRD